MSSSNFCLADFVRSIPICRAKTEINTLSTIFRSSQQQFVAILDRGDRLVGIVSERQILARLLALNYEQSQPVESEELEKLSRDTSDLNLPIEMPIVLSSQMSASDFLPYLQAENSENTDNPVYAIVDREEKFLGILDSRSLLKSLVLEDRDRHPSSSPRSSQAETELWFESIEKIPLPLSIQSFAGNIICKNHCWQEQIENTEKSDCSAQTSIQQNFSEFSYSVPNSKNERYKLLPSQPEPYCVSNNYYLETPDLQEESNLESGAIERLDCQVPLRNEKALKSIELTQPLCSEPIATNTTNWRSIKLPFKIIEQYGLKGEIALSEIKADNSNQPDGWRNECPIDPNAPFWLVLATQVKSESTQELVAKNADLIELNRLKDEFLSTLGHELKSPLTAIVGLSSLLKEKKLGELNQRQSRYSELIYHSARQLMELVNDLLDLARLEAGQIELTLKPLDIRQVCEHAYEKTIENLTKKKQQLTSGFRPKFTLTIEPGLKVSIADELRLRQMLINLLDNAYQFTPPDGEIGLVVNRWDNWIAFTVKDNGIGIPEEVQNSMLQQLSQPQNSWARSSNGKGLGLRIAQKLALAHGGDISFISQVGRGSEFTILLPFYSGDRQEQRIDNSINTVDRGTENSLVLLVEENADSIEQMTVKLRELGYHVVIARTKTEALEKARQLQPAKILLDPYLSLLSGWEILTLLKSDSKLKNIPTIVMARETEWQKARQCKADGFLSLPIATAALSKLFPRLRQQKYGDRQGLKILRLYPEAEASQSINHINISQFDLMLKNCLSKVDRCILEADSLEQADILARIWKLDVVVLDGSVLNNPLDYLRSLSQYEDLASLPLVILDAKTTEIANQFRNLSVFPCLLDHRQQSWEKLLEVIQIATGK